MITEGDEWMVGEGDQSVAHEETVGGNLFMDHDIQTEEIVTIDDLATVAEMGEYLEDRSRIDDLIPKDENGELILSRNLPELLSKVFLFEDEERIILCFSKKCNFQLVVSGYLYNVDGIYREEGVCTWRCINNDCNASLRTSAGFAELRFLVPNHCENCVADDLQIRLRVAVFDLRLMAEFTDVTLRELYKAYVVKLLNESPDVMQLFPSWISMERTLEEHRNEKTYRKRFEIQKLIQTRMIRADMAKFASSRAQEHIQYFRKTKPLPAATCVDCGANIRSAIDAASQDLLIGHLHVDHGKTHLGVSMYEFDDTVQFEHWIRALMNRTDRPECKMRKLGVFDEAMYYLCDQDHRHVVAKKRSEEAPTTCTAFVRVRDFRSIHNRDTTQVVVDFCLEHWHSDSSEEHSLYPYEFIRSLEDRRKKTQTMIEETKMERIPRIAAMGMASKDRGNFSCVPALSLNIGRCRLQQHSNYGYTMNRDLDDEQVEEEYFLPSEIQMDGDHHIVRMADEQHGMGAMIKEETLTEKVNRVGPLSNLTCPPNGKQMTQRGNFKDFAVFNHVLQFEKQCDILKQRMQMCRSVTTGKKYLFKICNLVAEMTNDPGLCRAWEKEQLERKQYAQKRVTDRRTIFIKGRQMEQLPVQVNEDEPYEDEVEYLNSAKRPALDMLADCAENQPDYIQEQDPCADPDPDALAADIFAPVKQENAGQSNSMQTVDKPVEEEAGTSDKQGNSDSAPSPRMFLKRNADGKMVLVKRTVVRRVRQVPAEGKKKAPVLTDRRVDEGDEMPID